MFSYLFDLLSFIIYGNNYKITICSEDSHLMNPIINISPDIIRKGEDITINITGDLDKPLLSGLINVIIKLNGSSIVTKKYNLCEKNQCPVNDGKPGHVEFTYVESIPGFAFPGKYNAELTITDQDNEDVLCLDIDIDL